MALIITAMQEREKERKRQRQTDRQRETEREMVVEGKSEGGVVMVEVEADGVSQFMKSTPASIPRSSSKHIGSQVIKSKYHSHKKC